jgi:hypothetical protein
LSSLARSIAAVKAVVAELGMLRLLPVSIQSSVPESPTTPDAGCRSRAGRQIIGHP